MIADYGRGTAVRVEGRFRNGSTGIKKGINLCYCALHGLFSSSSGLRGLTTTVLGITHDVQFQPVSFMEGNISATSYSLTENMSCRICGLLDRMLFTMELLRRTTVLYRRMCRLPLLSVLWDFNKSIILK